MTRIITGTVSVDPGGSIVTAWSNTDGVALSEITAPAGSSVVIEGRANYIKTRLSTTSFELMLPHAGDGGAGLDCAISALTAGETQIGTLNARTATVIQQLGVLDANGRGLFYNLIGATGDNDPGPGRMAFNNADPELVTEIYLDVLDANEGGRDVSGLVGLWTPGTTLIVRSIASTAYAAFRLVAAPEDAGGYRRATVESVGADGTLAAEPVSVEWLISGSGMEIGAIGTFAGRSDFGGETHPFVYASVDGDGAEITTSVLFQKRSLAPDDWSGALPFQGTKGDTGDRGWTMVFASVPDGDRRVDRLVGYIGGEGTPPSYGIGQYRGPAGLVVNIVDATDNRGAQGLAGTIDGLTPFMQERVTEDETAADTRAALGIVPASQSEAEAGTDNAAFMTPLRTAEAIAKLAAPGGLNDAIFALEISDLKGARLGMIGGIADAFDDQTGVDAGTSTGFDYDATNDWFRGVSGLSQDIPLTGGSAVVGSTTFTLATRAFALHPNRILKSIGVYSAAAGTQTVKIVRRISSTSYEVIQSHDFTAAVGWNDLVLPAPFAVPGTGTYHVASVLYPISNFTVAAGNRAYANGNAPVGTGAWVEDTGNIIPLRTRYVVENMDLRSIGYTAAAQPASARLAVQAVETSAVTINTDLIGYVSRDNGATWQAATLALATSLSGIKMYESPDIDLSALPAGTSMRWRLRTQNNSDVAASGVVLQWR